MCEYDTVCCKVAVAIRELIFDEAVDFMQGAMVGEPGECFAFALEWIKKQKGLPYRVELFESLKSAELAQLSHNT